MPKQILIADNEPLTVRLLRTALEAKEFEVLSGATCREVVQIFQENLEIRLVLLDRHLPAGDAVEALKEIRRTGRVVPVWMVTGPADACAMAEIVNEGADHVLNKPFEIRSLVELIAEVVEVPTVVLEGAGRQTGSASSGPRP